MNCPRYLPVLCAHYSLASLLILSAGIDARRVVLDGWPPEQVVGVDVNPSKLRYVSP
jgi:hypothetical protein